MEQPKPRICLECKHCGAHARSLRIWEKPNEPPHIYHYVGDSTPNHHCLRNAVQRRELVNGVQYVVRTELLACEDERTSSWGCGPEGRFWEPLSIKQKTANSVIDYLLSKLHLK